MLKVLTLSFWVKSNKTGTYIFELDDKIIIEPSLKLIQ
jgi:hypothetical protein